MARASFHPLAARELIDAAGYYDLESPGLGALFLDAAERCEQAIVEHPRAGTVILGDIRRRLLQTFPYGLLYRVTPDGVRILAVMNLRRRPMYWVGRE
jgi:plasmid stabilization system protein ParE